MDFIDFVSSWRKSTHHFTSESLWNTRLNQLGIYSMVDMKKYWENLQCLNKRIRNFPFNESKIDVKRSDGVHSLVEHRIAIELCEFTEKSIQIAGIPLVFCKQAKDNLITLLLSELWNITHETFLFEHRVFTSAFPEKNTNYAYFINTITSRAEWLDDLKQTYPILCDDLGIFCNNYKHFIAEFCKRLQTDLHDIYQMFGIPYIAGHIAHFNPFCGDMHKQGRNTISISLSDSSTHSLYTFFYKPKSLSSDYIWNNLIQKMWNLGLKQTVLLTTNIDKGTYGWQKEVTSYAEVGKVDVFKSFCFNQGVNIALAYFLGIQDLIADNILVRGDMPVFFDMEMLLSPIPRQAGDYLTASSVSRHYLQGVIKTGLVPCFGFETLDQTGYDNSGLCMNSHNKTSIPNPSNKSFYAKDLFDGFDYACNFIKTHQYEICSIIESVADSRFYTRYLVRFTFNYAQLLKALYSPLCQGDAIQRHLTMEFLWRGYNKNIMNEKIIQDEIRQIKNGDIPLFTTQPCSTNLYNEKGEIVVENYFQTTGISASTQKILKFSEEEALLQKDVIRRALYIHGYIDSSNVEHPFSLVTESKKCDLVSQIANVLYSLPCIKDDKYFAYIDYTISKDDIWDQGIQHLDFFQGMAGVGVFFMAWYKLSQDSMAKKYVTQIYDESIEYLKYNKNTILDSPVTKLGIMHFPTSILYYYIMGQKIMGNEGPILANTDLIFILDFIEEKYTDDRYLDYFSGTTGLLLVLMELYKIHSLERIRKVIYLLGVYLLNSAIEINEDMISWEKKSFSLWGGFAHGNSCMAYALFKMWDFFGEERFYQAGIKALAYDQALFVPSKSYWKKTLSVEGDIHHSWGSGSAGIGLSRYLISFFYKNALMEDEIRTSLYIINKELENKTYTDHSIASGLLGLLEIAGILDKSFPIKQYLKSEFSFSDLSELQCGGWKGNPTITGLYYGYAGIGYNLIKLYSLPNLPSLLWI